ncbi:E3 ubiquitin-protein ligase TRIM17-like [Podarcis muralis]
MRHNCEQRENDDPRESDFFDCSTLSSNAEVNLKAESLCAFFLKRRLAQKCLRASALAGDDPAAPGIMASSLVDDLVCSVCLFLFRDPHVLDCGHNFCLDCLKSCARDGWGRGICPECRCPFRLREVRRHRVLDNLAEKARKLQLDEEPQARASSAGSCEEHEEPLKLFCRQDRVPICVICRDQPAHRGHEFLPTKDAVKCAQMELKPYLKPLKERLKEAKEEKIHQKEAIGELKSCTEDIINHISTGFESLHQILDEKEKAIRKTVQEKRKKNWEEMQDAFSCLKNDISSLTEIINKVKAALESTDHVAFLKDFQELMKQAKDSIEVEVGKDDNNATEEEDKSSDEEEGESSEEEEEYSEDEEKKVTLSFSELLKRCVSDEEQDESSEEEEEYSEDDEKTSVPVFSFQRNFKVDSEEPKKAKDSIEEEENKDDNNAAEAKDEKANEEQGESSEEKKEEYSGDNEKNVVPVFPSLKKFKVALDFEAWGKMLQGIELQEEK